MLEDVKASVKWAFDNADKFGGDPERIFLVGQSAGAHLSAVAMIQQAKMEKEADEGKSSEFPSWRSSRLRGFVGISGPYVYGRAERVAVLAWRVGVWENGSRRCVW
jgi:prenylcysteine alpha-carboxyl methylesterase